MLVLGGETFLWDIPEVKGLKELVHNLGLETSVLFPGYLLDEDLSCFYSACDFFVFPSLYEGFGLPVLEAMKCGAPLLVSNCSSVPEVAEDAGFYFNPKLPENLVEVFWEAFGDREGVQARREIGIERASKFTWSAAAGIIHGLYDRYGT
jgi:glycosyltransferase involved in cell wall biosynthesis